MDQPIIGKKVTPGANTITIESVAPSDDFEALIIKGETALHDAATVEFTLDEKTGDGNLELLFSGAHIIERSTRGPQIILVDDGDRSAYYTNPSVVDN